MALIWDERIYKQNEQISHAFGKILKAYYNVDKNKRTHSHKNRKTISNTILSKLK